MRESKIARATKRAQYPVAVLKTDQFLEGALHFKQGKRGCVIAFLSAAAKGKTAIFSESTTPCPGGRAGLGFCRIPDHMKYFLSDGGQGFSKGEFYKKTPELAQRYIEEMKLSKPAQYIVFKPFNFLEEDERPEVVIFLVNADQLSGLVTLANYDCPTQDNVHVEFGAGCAQSILYALLEQETGHGKCIIGLTDPSARKVIQKELLSFSIPYQRFLEMENNVDSSFLTKDTWEFLLKRI